MQGVNCLAHLPACQPSAGPLAGLLDVPSRPRVRQVGGIRRGALSRQAGTQAGGLEGDHSGRQPRERASPPQAGHLAALQGGRACLFLALACGRDTPRGHDISCPCCAPLLWPPCCSVLYWTCPNTDCIPLRAVPCHAVLWCRSTSWSPPTPWRQSHRACTLAAKVGTATCKHAPLA